MWKQIEISKSYFLVDEDGMFYHAYMLMASGRVIGNEVDVEIIAEANEDEEPILSHFAPSHGINIIIPSDVSKENAIRQMCRAALSEKALYGTMKVELLYDPIPEYNKDFDPEDALNYLIPWLEENWKKLEMMPIEPQFPLKTWISEIEVSREYLTREESNDIHRRLQEDA